MNGRGEGCGPYLVRLPVVARELDGYPLDLWPGQLLHVAGDSEETGHALCTAQCADCSGLIWFRLPWSLVRSGQHVVPAPQYPTVEEWEQLRQAHQAAGVVCRPPPH